MLDRNRRIKPKPERFQDNFDKFDIIFTCEERVYDQVIEGLLFMAYFICSLIAPIFLPLFHQNCLPENLLIIL